MDRGAWWSAVCGVAKSRTRLSNTHTHTHTRDRRIEASQRTGCQNSKDPGPQHSNRKHLELDVQFYLNITHYMKLNLSI